MKNALFLSVGIACCVACGQLDDTSTVASLRTVERLFDDPSVASLQDAVVTNEVEVFRWIYRSPGDLASWDLSGIERRSDVERPGLSLLTTTHDPQMVWDVDFDSQTVDTIKLVFHGEPTAGAVNLFWATEGAPFRPNQKKSASKSTRTWKNRDVIYTFSLGKHPRWRGSIDKIRIEPTNQEGRSVNLISVSGSKAIVDPVRFRELASKEFRIDQCGDVRNGRVMAPGMPVSLSVDLPENAKIRFTYGLQDGAPGPVTLRVSLVRGEDSKDVFEKVVEKDKRHYCRWQESVVDLTDLGQGEADLVFETQSDGDYDLGRGFPVLSQVEILKPVLEPDIPNVVLIIVDTLRADRLSLYGYERETSPNVRTWAGRDGVVFENTITAAPWTLPSHVSLFTGLDSLTHGMTADDPIPLGAEMIAEKMQELGYRTAAFTGGGYVGETYGLMQGFDSLSYWFKAKRKPTETGNDLVAGITDAIDWIDHNQEQTPSQPFFVFFHTYEVHTPYRRRDPFFDQFHSPEAGEPASSIQTSKIASVFDDGFRTRRVFTAKKPGGEQRYVEVEDRFMGLVGDIYDSSVAFADLHVGRLLNFLEERGLSENTVVVFTSDHGESLGEKGLAAHSSLEEWEIKVPLVIAGPGLEDFHGTRVETQVRLIDVMPTILDLVGAKPPADIDGVSLLPAIQGAEEGLPGDAITYAASSNFGLALRRENRVKFEFNNTPWAPVFAAESLFLLEEDPLCVADVAETSKDADRFRRILLDRFKQTKAGLRMQFSNSGDKPMTVVLTGGQAKPVLVKSVEPEAAGLHWSGSRVDFLVEGKTERTLFFEGTPYSRIWVQCTIEGSGREPLDTGFRLEHPDDTWQVRFDQNVWQQGDGAKAGTETGIRAWIHGWTSATVSGTTVDQETMEILRSLGYVE